MKIWTTILYFCCLYKTFNVYTESFKITEMSQREEMNRHFTWISTGLCSAGIILIFSEYSFRDVYGVCFFNIYRTHTYLGICVYVHLYKYIYTHIHMYMSTYVYIFLCALMHTCTHNVLWFISRPLMWNEFLMIIIFSFKSKVV